MENPNLYPNTNFSENPALGVRTCTVINIVFNSQSEKLC